MLSVLRNLRTLPRQLFGVLTVILNETRTTRETVAAKILETSEQLQQIDEMLTANTLILKPLAPGLAALNEFCGETAQLLLQQQRQIETLLGANKLLIERAHATFQLVEGQDKRIFALEEVMKAQATVLPSWHATPEAAAEIRDVLRLLTPRAAANSAKQRFGRDFDGGYIMLEDFKGAAVALSLGIKDDVSWDLDVARRGLEVFQFDHTIAALPETHERFHFNPLRIAATPADGSVSLEQAFALADCADASPVILKMDIEGDEWAVLENVPDHILERCSQIIVEFHRMERLMEPESLLQARRVFEKLTSSFFLCHVHGNNCGNLVNVHNIVLPETLEMTFAKTGLYQSSDTQEVFPQKPDMPNQPGRADFFLGTFKF